MSEGRRNPAIRASICSILASRPFLLSVNSYTQEYLASSPVPVARDPASPESCHVARPGGPFRQASAEELRRVGLGGRSQAVLGLAAAWSMSASSGRLARCCRAISARCHVVPLNHRSWLIGGRLADPRAPTTRRLVFCLNLFALDDRDSNRA
jgi:hypothetical protein